MTRTFRLLAAAAALGLLAGCSSLPIIGKRKPATDPEVKKDSKHLATDVENEFRQRWIERRVNELVGQGVSPEAARTQAAAEFSQKYSVTNAAHQ